MLDTITSPPSNGASKDLQVLHLTLHEAPSVRDRRFRHPFPQRPFMVVWRALASGRNAEHRDLCGDRLKPLIARELPAA
jgi:hypothetical protein